MDLLNVNRDTENVEPSTPLSNGRAGHTRESSPASSSTLSHNNEDSVDIPDLTPVSIGMTCTLGINKKENKRLNMYLFSISEEDTLFH